MHFGPILANNGLFLGQVPPKIGPLRYLNYHLVFNKSLIKQTILLDILHDFANFKYSCNNQFKTKKISQNKFNNVLSINSKLKDYKQITRSKQFLRLFVVPDQ